MLLPACYLEGAIKLSTKGSRRNNLSKLLSAQNPCCAQDAKLTHILLLQGILFLSMLEPLPECTERSSLKKKKHKTTMYLQMCYTVGEYGQITLQSLKKGLSWKQEVLL